MSELTSKIRSLLRGMLASAQANRMKLPEVCRSLGVEIPQFKDLELRFFDPVILGIMKKMQYDSKDMNELVQSKGAPEYHIYRMIMNKLYLKKDRHTALWAYAERSTDIIARNLKLERRLFCCYQRTCLELVFNSEVTAEMLLKPFRSSYTIFPLRRGKKMVQFPNKMLIIEVSTRPGKCEMCLLKLELVCGEVDEFCQVLASVMCEYTKSLVEVMT